MRKRSDPQLRIDAADGRWRTIRVRLDEPLLGDHSMGNPDSRSVVAYVPLKANTRVLDCFLYSPFGNAWGGSPKLSVGPESDPDGFWEEINLGAVNPTGDDGDVLNFENEEEQTLGSLIQNSAVFYNSWWGYRMRKSEKVVFTLTNFEGGGGGGRVVCDLIVVNPIIPIVGEIV